jgi:hypothetical protein
MGGLTIKYPVRRFDWGEMLCKEKDLGERLTKALLSFIQYRLINQYYVNVY